MWSMLNDLKLSASDYYLLVLGSPTRMRTMSWAIRGFIGKLKSEDWAGKSFIALDTEGH